HPWGFGQPEKGEVVRAAAAPQGGRRGYFGAKTRR
ncbi:MAG: hypothetical protein ACJA1L_001804, partial [Paracoccaceae bacterium]